MSKRRAEIGGNLFFPGIRTVWQFLLFWRQAVAALFTVCVKGVSHLE